MSFVPLANKLRDRGQRSHVTFNMPGSVLIIHNLPDATNDERDVTMTTKTLEVLNLMSELIMDNLHGAANEQYGPRFDADRMDAEIKFHKERAAKLRVIRQEFEDTMTGVL